MEPRVLWALAIILALVVPGQEASRKVTWITKYTLKYKNGKQQFSLEMMKYPVDKNGHSLLKKKSQKKLKMTIKQKKIRNDMKTFS